MGVVMLIVYTEALCRMHGQACVQGQHDECPKHPTLILPCKWAVRKEELER